jgi:hypothetical protein
MALDVEGVVDGSMDGQEWKENAGWNPVTWTPTFSALVFAPVDVSFQPDCSRAVLSHGGPLDPDPGKPRRRTTACR